MSMTDKIKHAAEKAEGKAKEAVGKHTDDHDLQAEGKRDQVSGDLKNAGEKLKDAVKD